MPEDSARLPLGPAPGSSGNPSPPESETGTPSLVRVGAEELLPRAKPSPLGQVPGVREGQGGLRAFDLTPGQQTG